MQEKRKLVTIYIYCKTLCSSIFEVLECIPCIQNLRSKHVGENHNVNRNTIQN
jgi:hypothetical protein